MRNIYTPASLRTDRKVSISATVLARRISVVRRVSAWDASKECTLVKRRAHKQIAAMKKSKNDIKARVRVPGAVARQELNFGDAAGYGKMAGDDFSLKQGTDLAPLLE